jgi:hypothetical protein
MVWSSTAGNEIVLNSPTGKYNEDILIIRYLNV